MKDYHIVLAAAMRLVREGADHAGAISTALADIRYTYGHPADYLRVALRLDAHLRAWEARPRQPLPVPHRGAAPKPIAADTPPPRGDRGQAAIRAVVYQDRAPVHTGLPASSRPPVERARRRPTREQLDQLRRRFPGAVAAMREQEPDRAR